MALVLVAGLGTPAFAVEGGFVLANEPTIFDSDTFSISSVVDPVVFDNGGVPALVGGWIYDSNFHPVDDFELAQDTVITDLHFVNFGTLGSIQFFIYADASGQPGNLLASGNAIDVEINSIGDGFDEVWFLLDEPFLANAGERYWFGLHTTDNVLTSWAPSTDVGFGEAFHQSFEFPPITFIDRGPDDTPEFRVHLWFQLTGHPPDVVGGELLPIDSTALMLAGLQTSAIWMLPVLAGVAGSAFGVLYIKSRRN